MSQNQSELIVITKAKELCSYVMTVTQKSPKHFRFTFVTRMQNLSLDVIENLYRANFQRVYNYAYYSLLNSAEAEDVTSAVFVKVVANIDKYDASRASFGTWITRIAHNVLVDYHRTRKPTVSLEKVVVDEPAVEDDYPVLDDRQQRVAKLLACLSEQDRELIYLKYYQEKKNVEIAQLLDMNPMTVATRLRRALITMRARAEEETS